MGKDDKDKAKSSATPAPAAPTAPKGTVTGAPKAGPKAGVKRTAGKDRAKTKTEIEAAKLKKKLEAQKLKKSTEVLGSFRESKIVDALKSGKLKPHLWSFGSKADLTKVKSEWKYLGIPKEHATFCSNMFKQVESASATVTASFTFAMGFLRSARDNVTAIAATLTLDKQRKKNAKKMLGNLMDWEIGVARRSGKINPQLWDFRSRKGMARIKKEWSYLGILKGNSAYWNGVFKQLEKSHPHNLGGILRPSVKFDCYSDPIKNLDKLEANTDKDFATAVRQFVAMKKMVENQDKSQIATTKNLQERNKDSIISTATRVVQENLVAFRDAIKNRDYSTAAVYIIGIYALWRSYKSLPKPQQDRYSKYIFWGAAAYCSNIFLKKAGIDIGKKLGFTDADAEVKGTPMAVLSRLNLTGLKPGDYITARDVNFENFSDLYSQYQKTNGNPAGLRWIDPNQYNAFGDRFRGMRYGDISRKRGAPGKTGLSAKQKAYKEKGESLYRVVQALEEAYNKTMRPGTKGQRTLGAVLSSGILAKSSVFDFVVALERYAPETRESKSITAQLKGTEKAKNRLREAFKGSGLGFNLDKGRKAGHYDGVLMGFPVVYVKDARNKRFLVFARSDYDQKNKTPHVGSRLGSIPYKGNAAASITALRGKIHAKVVGADGLLSRFKRNSRGLATFTNVRYDHAHGGWTADLSYKRGNIIKGTGPIPMKVTIEIGDKGRAISMTRGSGGQLVYIKDVLDANAFYGNMAISQLVTQRATGGATDFSALQWLLIDGRLTFADNDPSDDKFRIKIKNVPLTIWIRLNSKGQYEFVAKDMEQKLLRHSEFKRSLRESVGNSKKLKGAIEDLRRMVRGTKESYFFHFFKSVPSWFSKATWKDIFRGVQLSHFTGSVAKKYTYSLIEAQREKILTDFEISLSGAKSLSDIGDHVNKTLPAAIAQFKQLTRKLSEIRDRQTAEGDAFDAAEYSDAILTDLMAIGCKSNDYKEWYRRFSVTLLAGNTPDDIRNTSKVQQLMKVFAYYTAPIDKKEIDGANLWAKKPKPLPTTATDTEKSKYKADLAEWEKTQKHRLHAAYAQYVADQIHLKMKIPGRTRFPGPSNDFWKMRTFSQFDPAQYVSSHEMIDTRPTWRPNRDYVPYTTYVKMLKQDKLPANFDENLVILDRKNFKVTLPSDPAKMLKAQTLLEKISGNFRFDKMRITDLEKAFFAKLRRAVLELKNKYGLRAKPGAIRKFLALYRYAYQPANDSKTPPTYTYQFGREDTTYSGNFKKSPSGKSDMKAAMGYFDQLGLNSGTTITKTQQENLLNITVAHIIKTRILSPPYFGHYFQKRGLLRFMREKWVGFKDWVYGLRN